MSKVIYVCFRNRPAGLFTDGNMQLLSARLMPDNITVLPPQVIDRNGIYIAIFGPNPAVRVENTSVCLGQLLPQGDEWWQPLHGQPDGSFALFRGDSRYVEVMSDVLATRTVWYFKNDDLFIASTSQRGIICLLESVAFNEAAIPWMLSSGSLGPAAGWDTRLNLLANDASVVLDRAAWTLTLHEIKPDFTPSDCSIEEHYQAMLEVLHATFQHPWLAGANWMLPLSGGFDSRAILCLLNRSGQRPNTVTWGVSSSLSVKDSDAAIARLLARRLEVGNEFFELDRGDVQMETVFERFLVCGEGRVDHISGYADGFMTWKRLFEAGVHGILRGDEAFGNYSLASTQDLKRTIGLTLCSDHSALKPFAESYYSGQHWPPRLAQMPGETLASWRDRLQQLFRQPIIISALNDLKTPYVEIVNPLITRRVMRQLRRLPDDLRTNKKLFRTIVYDLSPDVPIANQRSIDTEDRILSSAPAVVLLRDELSARADASILPADLVRYILDHLQARDSQVGRGRKKVRGFIKRYMPQGLRSKARSILAQQPLSHNVLAFRAFIICRMKKMLTEDARSLAVHNRR